MTCGKMIVIMVVIAMCGIKTRKEKTTMKQIFTRSILFAVVAVLSWQTSTAQIVDKDPVSPDFGQVVWLGSPVASNTGKYVYHSIYWKFKK